MRNISLILSFVLSYPAVAEHHAFEGARLAIGYYYPSLKKTSNITDIEISLTYWTKELTDKIGLKNSYAILFKDSSKMHAAFHSGKLDMIVAPPLLLATQFDRHQLSNGFRAVLQKNKPDQLVIIVQQKLNSPSINFLNKTLLLPTDDLMAKVFMETEVLKSYKRPLKSVFSQIMLVDKSRTIILDLFFEKADVAVVFKSSLDLMIEMNPQIEKKIKILKAFPIKSRHFGYFHRDYKIQNILKELAKNFTSETRGKQILEVFQNTDIKPTFVDELIFFDDYYQKYLALKVTLNND